MVEARLLLRQLSWLCASLAIGCSTQEAPSDAGAGSDTGAPVCDIPFRSLAPARSEEIGLRINEALSSNDGAAIDEAGETDDFVELVNIGSEPIELGSFFLADANHHARLPDRTLAPGEYLLLWADAEPDQGPSHLPFKLEREGETLSLWRDECTQLDLLEVPALEVNEAFARFPDGAASATRCRYASPGRTNQASCEPPAPPGLRDEVTFSTFSWPSPWPVSSAELVITELSLGPNGFIELSNPGPREVALSGLSLRLSAHAPGATLPDAHAGVPLALPASQLPAGARIVIPLDPSLVSSTLTSGTREGIVRLFSADAVAIDQLDFMSVPDGAALTRELHGARLYRLCANPSPGTEAACVAHSERPVTDRLRALNAAGDFDALARGGTEVGTSAVKFVIDMQTGDTVHLLSNERWALHYTFVREQIDHQPALDRCDPTQSAQFQQSWYEFSVREYFRVQGRRYLLGTLVRNANGLFTVEFAVGDTIVAEQMKRAFFAIVQHTEDPTRWALRPQDLNQLAEMTKLDGELPIVGMNAPFRDLSYQPLTRAVGFGTLRFVPAAELFETVLGPQVLVITDDVPNDMPLTGGLITEAFQTPLAHINVLSEARGTPNMALRNARTDPKLSPWLGKLVRLEVGASDFQVREASAEEAEAFYASRRPSGPRRVPFSDDTLRGVQDLSDHALFSAAALGSKAAQLAELAKVKVVGAGCPAESLPLALPQPALAIPVAHYRDHFEASGAAQKLGELLADPAFRADANARAEGLSTLRALVMKQPVEPALLNALEAALRARFDEAVLRFRSSSNVEDLDTFNGAGLHTSTSASLQKNAEVSIEDGLRVVWASLWNERAFEERELGNLEQSATRMAVLIHERFEGEAAQGVAISRNLFDVARSDMYYVNAQRGEASVTNPAPGVATEQLLYSWQRPPEVSYQSLSSLTGDAPVLSLPETRTLVCALRAIHQHFAPLLDPAGTNHTFAMQIEWKLEHQTRKLFVKQARPQPFANAELPSDCR